MKITIARHAGFCFGVRRAIDITFKVRQSNPDKRIYTLGQIIHNPQVIDALTRRGIGIVHDISDPTLRPGAVSYTHLRAHETPEHLVCRLLLEKKQTKHKEPNNTLPKQT